jgi:hypothetical protein
MPDFPRTASMRRERSPGKGDLVEAVLQAGNSSAGGLTMFSKEFY